MGPIAYPELAVILMVGAAGMVIVAWPAARICMRIGLSPWLGLLAAIPVANVVLLWFVAFAPWPGLPLGQRGT